ncbi:hypothetical protein BN132_48 [Cronobacter turicensis 564]|nr:hypothetical protein BN132_48 [Cronobacter turicensis 564]
MPSFSKNSAVSMPSQSAQGSTPFQLCCIGFSSAALVGAKVCISARLLQPNRLKAAAAQKMSFFTVFPYCSWRF